MYQVTFNDGVIGTGRYELDIHDEVEKVNDFTSKINISYPLWGSGPTDNSDSNGLWLLAGPKRAGDPITLQKGKAHSTGLSLDDDVPLTKFAKVNNINIMGAGDHDGTVTPGTVIPLPCDIPAGQYAYPVENDSYNRHFVSFRHYTPPGEDKRFTPVQLFPLYVKHRAVRDIYVGYNITWNGPYLIGEPTPPYDPNPTPPPPPSPVSP